MDWQFYEKHFTNKTIYTITTLKKIFSIFAQGTGLGKNNTFFAYQGKINDVFKEILRNLASWGLVIWFPPTSLKSQKCVKNHPPPPPGDNS